MARTKIDPPKGGNNLQNVNPNYPKGTNIPKNPPLPTKQKKSTLETVVDVVAGPPVGNLINKVNKKNPTSNIDQSPMAPRPLKGGAGGGGGMQEDGALSPPSRGMMKDLGPFEGKLSPNVNRQDIKATPANPKIEKMDIKGPQKIKTSKPRTSPEKLPDAPKPKHKLSPKEVMTNMKLGINHMRQLNEESRSQ